MNYSLSCENAADLLEMTDTDFLLCGDNGATKKNPDAMEHLRSLRGIPANHCLDIRLSSMDLSAVFRDTDPEAELIDDSDADAPALIIFTSGTTSRPKAVQISQRALTFGCNAYNETAGEHAGHSFCTAVPLFHIFGLIMTYAYLSRGATVCLPVDLKADTLIHEIATYCISDMAAVGAIYLSLADAENFEKNAAPHLHLCTIAGGMSTPVQMMRLELQFFNATFLNMYGQTEACPLTLVSPTDLVEKRAQTVGKVLNGLDVRISDDKGNFLSQGEIGEVVARGTNLMNGYDKLPGEKQSVDEKGWLHTGDLGYFDADNYLHLSGRMKDIIIRGGENISPSEIESALTQMDNIREAKVMGAPHPIYGESVEACITMTDDGAGFDQDALKSALRSRIARFKVPSHIFLYDKFPLNVNGKLDQRALHADMLTRLRRLEVDEELAGGVTVFDLVVQNSRYAIMPVTGMAEKLAEAVGFSRNRIRSTFAAVEEMLTERILDAYAGAGKIRVKFTLMPEWLRITFSDSGAEYFIDKRRDTSMAAKIILNAVDNFHTDYVDGKPIYCMDFLYESDFSIQDFLISSKEEEHA